jgi:hypothetical protein
VVPLINTLLSMKCFAAFMEELLKGILLGDFQCDLLDQLDTFQQGDLCD